MKNIVFDTSSLVSIVTNDMLWILKPLKEHFDNGKFLIPPSVKKELVEYPIKTNRFKFEAVQVQSFIESEILEMSERIDVTDLIHKVNSIYKANGNPIKILHYGEMEALALAIKNNADAYVVDERTMRWIIEDPDALRLLLEKKLHTNITMDRQLISDFKNYVKDLKILRSTEIMMAAYELGLFNQFVTREYGKKELVDGILWGLRLKGCVISTEEIKNLVKMEVK